MQPGHLDRLTCAGPEPWQSHPRATRAPRSSQRDNVEHERCCSREAGTETGCSNKPVPSLTQTRFETFPGSTATTTIAGSSATFNIEMNPPSVRLTPFGGHPDPCEPKTLRYRFLQVPARLTNGSRRRHLRFPRTWPRAKEIVAAFTAIRALTAIPSPDLKPRPSLVRPRPAPPGNPPRSATRSSGMPTDRTSPTSAQPGPCCPVSRPHDRPKLVPRCGIVLCHGCPHAPSPVSGRCGWSAKCCRAPTGARPGLGGTGPA